LYMGAPRWPPNPHRSGRPGEAVAPLYFRLTAGGPEMAPQPPPSFRPPRRRRGAPLFTWGPRDGPQSHIVRAASAEPWRPSISGLLLGPDMARSPSVRAAPAEPWRSSISGLLLGARRGPNPPSFGPPRRSRGGPLFQAYFRRRPISGGARASYSGLGRCECL